MNDLVDRYVHSVARHLPRESREDVTRELRTTIDDMVDARVAHAHDGADVREVLAELGDPRVLAAGYRSGPRYLIGPDQFDHYATALRSILSIALPVMLGIQLVFGNWEGDRSIVALLLSAIGGTLQVGVHIVLWTTVVFVVLERTGTQLDEAPSEWTPDDLPELPPERQIGLGDTIASVVVLLLIPLALLWQHNRSPFEDGEGAIPLLHPDLWSFWLPLLLGVVLVNVAFEAWKYHVGRWTMPLLVGNVVLNAAFLSVVGLTLGTQEVWNPEYLTAMAEHSDFALDDSPVLQLVFAGTVVVCVWDVVDALVAYFRGAKVQVAASRPDSKGHLA